MPAIPDVTAFTLAPDRVCEVLSASTAALDRARKLACYARAEVAHRAEPEGATRDEILRSYPTLQPEHIDAALAYAAELAREQMLLPLRSA